MFIWGIVGILASGKTRSRLQPIFFGGADCLEVFQGTKGTNDTTTGKRRDALSYT